MSGHSHAKTVMATKMANAAKKGKAFSKMAKVITIAAKDGGDPTKNSKLKAAIEQAKACAMARCAENWSGGASLGSACGGFSAWVE